MEEELKVLKDRLQTRRNWKQEGRKNEPNAQQAIPIPISDIQDECLKLSVECVSKAAVLLEKIGGHVGNTVPPEKVQDKPVSVRGGASDLRHILLALNSILNDIDDQL